MTTNARTRKEDVVRAAGRLFAERGFHGTSMRDLGTELGLEGSSLYSHIDGKNELLVEVITRGAAMFQGLADAVLATDDSPERQLRALIVGHVQIVVDHLDEARTFLNEARFLPEPEHSSVVEMRRRYQGAFTQVIQEGSRGGIWRQGLDPQLAAIFVLSVLNALDRWYRPTGRRSPSEIAADIFDFVTTGLA
ncbi:MAG: TetR/AcrR family transcriptional regulator [Acidimicrobiia bacterium]